MPDHLDQFSKDKQIIIHCQSGDRSAIANSILARNGFANVKNYAGGMKEWTANNEAVIKSKTLN